MREVEIRIGVPIGPFLRIIVSYPTIRIEKRTFKASARLIARAEFFREAESLVCHVQLLKISL
jgi:hypothetical protein